MTDNSSGSSSSGSNCSTYDYSNTNYVLNHLENGRTKFVNNFSDQNKEFLESPTSKEKQIMNSKDMTSKVDGYCEFCRRNFCNKYYLKRHKLEVHGIHTNSDKISWKRLKIKDHKNLEIQKLEMEKNISSFNMSIKEEINSPPATKPVLNPFHIESLNSTPKTVNSDLIKYDKLWCHLNQTVGESNGESEHEFNPCLNPKENINIPCPYCYQIFNRSNLVMHHLITCHADFIQDFMKFLSFSYEALEQQRTNKMLRNQVQPNILQMIYGQFINSSNPITDRVKCDVCYKDICNKYYLKLHKQRMHNSICSQTDFKITSLCGEEFKNSLNPNEDESNSQTKVNKNPRNSECFSNKSIMDIYMKELKQSLENEKSFEDDPKFYKKETNEVEGFKNSNEILSCDEMKIESQIKPNTYQTNNFFNIYKLIDGTYNLNQDPFIIRESFHESPLDLSFKKSDWVQFNKKKICYSSESFNPIRRKIKSRLSRLKFLKRSSSYLIKKFRKFKQIQMMNQDLKHKIAFEVKEFFADTYPVEMSRNDVDKTDFIFGKKLVDLPVTGVYKNNPFAFLLQPVL